MSTEAAAHDLIGREHPAALLRAELTRLIDSHGGLVLVTGEAGIGKTTLVTSAAGEARRCGVLVVGGACWDSGGAPGYWPWVQVIRAVRRAAEPEEWAAAEEAAGGGLATLLGETRASADARQHLDASADARQHPNTSADGRQHLDASADGRQHPNASADTRRLHDASAERSTDARRLFDASAERSTDARRLFDASAERSTDARRLFDASAERSTDAFQLFDAVTSALVAISQRRPVLVVIDDLHAADPASLRLLEFAARQTWFERLLLIGTYRDAEVEPVDHPLRDLLSPLVAKATTITLTGLDRPGVAALMARTAGHDPPSELVEEVHLRTGGNPFFVEQTSRLWRSGGSASAVAPGIRDALLRRLSLLPRQVSELLPAAAVLGREFHRQVLAAAIGAPVAHVDRLLELAVVAKLVVTKGGGVFAFAHDLVRETLYDSLDDPRGRHAAVVAAVESSPTLAGRLPPSDLARHAYLAGDRLDPERAIGLLLDAAREARGRLAAEEQIAHLRRAYELSAAASPHRRGLIALDLGRELHHDGEREEARRLFEEAAAIARDTDDPELPARVALVFHSHYGRDQALDLLRDAHRRLAGGPAVPDEGLATALVLHLATRARQGGDDDALAFSLWAHHDIIWGPGTAAERVALMGELIAVAVRTADPDLEHFASALRWVAMIEQGDPRYLDEFHAYAARGRRSERPHLVMSTNVDASIIAGLEGRFAEAESLLESVHTEARHEHFAFMLKHHRWALMALRGSTDGQERLLRELRGSGHPCVPLLEALTALQSGDVGTASRRLDDEEPDDRMIQPIWLRLQAELAAVTQDPELCASARARLAPLRGQWVVSLFGWEISGPYDLWLGRVDAARGRWAEAVEELTAAYQAADAMRARPWSVLARAHLAEALLGRAAPGDARAADALLEGAWREAEELGMRQALEHVRLTPPGEGAFGQARTGAPGDEQAAPSGDHEEASPAPETSGEFRRDGAVWALAFAGRSAHMPDAKGLRDLHILLSRPGDDVPAVTLLAPEGGEIVVAARRMGGDEVLDEEARSRYRRRLVLLDEEIDRAAGLGDDDRAAELDRERAALLAELRAAAGLGGRTRRLGDEAERARKTVTARIRDTLRKLDHAHPELAAHLRAAVSTGSTCRYRPRDPIAWRL
ncbi:AAA family ATPase [Nonomuraea sp. PA05]|uniref:ATP-binding protein n=1 Tax=Nonomuraea sp. PA05 TaxID=2604466 RepID=UPI0011D6A1CD|nr:AAA family ATPase [Nonomuraea sp. PA05]TYB54373.1 AAA family ATPase [Nonomuraea sp. PA05]